MIGALFMNIKTQRYNIFRYFLPEEGSANLYNADSKWHPIEKRGKGYYFTQTPTLSLKDTNKKSTLATLNKEKKNTNAAMFKLGRAQSYRLKTGKYTGFTLIEIFNKDKPYFDFLKDRCSNQSLANAANYLSKYMN